MKYIINHAAAGKTRIRPTGSAPAELNPAGYMVFVLLPNGDTRIAVPEVYETIQMAMDTIQMLNGDG